MSRAAPLLLCIAGSLCFLAGSLISLAREVKT